MTDLVKLEKVMDSIDKMFKGYNTFLKKLGVSEEDTELYMMGKNPKCYEDSKEAVCAVLSDLGVSEELCESIYNEVLFIDMKVEGELLDSQTTYHNYLSDFNALLKLNTLEYTTGNILKNKEDVLAANYIAENYFENLEDLKYNVATCIPYITYRIKMQEKVFYAVAISYMKRPLNTLAIAYGFNSLELDVLLFSEDFKECYKTIAQCRVENGVPLIERISNPYYDKDYDTEKDNLDHKEFINRFKLNSSQN